jgi:spermidine synthase
MSESNNTMTIEDQRAKANFTFVECLFPGVSIDMELKRIFTSCTSEFQKIDIVQTSFGKTLVTDGKTQSTAMDEFAYHESLVHPSLLKAGLSLSSPDTNISPPRKVFIGGGGELATAREVLKHKSVDRVLMVDLDEVVLRECQKHLHEWGGNAVATNPRLELVIGDAYAYLMSCEEKFDVVIMDISDPIEAGPGVMLYTKEFYEHVTTLLNPNGVFVTQAGIGDGIAIPEGIVPGSDNDFTSFAASCNTLSSVFNVVLPYTVNIPSYGSDWGFIMAFNKTDENRSEDFGCLSVDLIDEMIDSRVTDINDVGKNNQNCKTGSDVLRYYDGISHRRMFALPKPLRKILKTDQRIITKDNPVFMY